MSILAAFASVDQKPEAVADFEFFLVAIAGDGNAGHVFHDEVGLTVGSGTGVEDFGDGGVIHDGEGLALGLETAEGRIVVHATAYEFESDIAADGSGLFGEPDLSHAAFAEFLEQAIGAEGFGGFEVVVEKSGYSRAGELTGLRVGGEQGF